MFDTKWVAVEMMNYNCVLLQLHFLCAFTTLLLNTTVSCDSSAVLAQSEFPKVA